jgi:aminoglycoside phosphotransferase (APT) family kinase protein
MSDLDALRSRIEGHLAEATGGAARVHALDRLAGGACQANYAVAIELGAGDVPGTRKMVLRSDASSSILGSLDRAQEFSVIRAAAAAGVRTPAAHWLARGLTRDGAYAYFLDWVEGEAIGRRIVAGPKLEGARTGLAHACAVELAKIHAITPSTHPDLFTAGSAFGTKDDPVGSALAFLRTMIDRVQERRPALELILRWLRENAPKGGDVTLVHGDFRTGNFMVTPEGLTGILDWEFAHWGAPAEDIAWISVRDWRFNQLKKPIGGFASRADFYAEYEKASGKRVDLREIHWWEVMGNARWGVGSLQQGERYLSGLDPDIELVAVARRAIEMEYEAMRLIGLIQEERSF